MSKEKPITKNHDFPFIKRKGSVMVFVALLMTVILMLAALTVDLGHVFVVRNQLQNAADSTALQGTAYLYPLSSNAPNWSLAQSKASNAVPLNKADEVALANATITPGYWDLTGVNGLRATSITPGPNDVPAIQVKISKSAGNNGGSVPLLFGSLMGINTVDLSATAIAVTGSPKSVQPGDVFPMAMPASDYSAYWNSATGSPKIDPSTGNPYIFNLSEGVQGGWTSFGTNTNSTSALRSLITNGNPTALNIGDDIWLTNGAKAALYSSVPTNVDVVVAVTAAATPGTQQPIIGFGAIHIISSSGGSSKTVQVQFTNNLKMSHDDPGSGTNYGTYTPPRLVR